MQLKSHESRLLGPMVSCAGEGLVKGYVEQRIDPAVPAEGIPPCRDSR